MWPEGLYLKMASLLIDLVRGASSCFHQLWLQRPGLYGFWQSWLLQPFCFSAAAMNSIFFWPHLSQITRTALCNPCLHDLESFQSIITSVSFVYGELTFRQSVIGIKCVNPPKQPCLTKHTQIHANLGRPEPSLMISLSRRVRISPCHFFFLWS